MGRDRCGEGRSCGPPGGESGGPAGPAGGRWVGGDRQGPPPRSVPGHTCVKLLAVTPAERSFTDGVSQGLSSLAPIVVAALGVCLAGALALMVGKAPLPPGLPVDLLLFHLGVSTGAPSPPGAETILLQIRLPRIVLAGMVGGALAIAGATYQGVFRNPLADPYLLGVASGASLGAVLAF